MLVKLDATEFFVIPVRKYNLFASRTLKPDDKPVTKRIKDKVDSRPLKCKDMSVINIVVMKNMKVYKCPCCTL